MLPSVAPCCIIPSCPIRPVSPSFGEYMMGLVCAFSHTGCMLRVHFCKVNVINHYFCDLLPLLKLSCSTTYVNKLLVLCFGALNIFAPILTILSSYIFIISSIFHIHSMEVRSKAFSTCSSHISAVALFYGSAAFMYIYIIAHRKDSFFRGKSLSLNQNIV